MNKKDEMANFNIHHIIIDFMVITIVYAFVYYVTPARLNTEARAFYLVMLLSFCVVYFLFMTFLRMYNMSTFLYTNRVLKNTTLSFIFSSFTMFLFLFIGYNTMFSRLFLLLFVLITPIMLNIEKLVLLDLRVYGNSSVKIIYVGDMRDKRKTYENFLRYMQISGFNFTVLGYIDTSEVDSKGDGFLGCLKDFEIILKQHPCDHVIFGMSIMEKWDLEPFLLITRDMGITSRVILDVYRFDHYKWFVSSLGLFPMITYYNVSLDPFLLAVKRLIDIIGSIIGIILSFPIMIITAIAIKIDSPGPVIFRQERVGQHGQIFHIFKFRSMYMDAEKRKQELMAQNEMGDSRLFKMKNDPRITKIGKIIRKTSIDELPQFFNVFIGNMSLVGTRPPTISEVDQYDRQHFRRISIKPGITGIWQTNGRNEITDFEKIVQMDVAYIENWSLLLDIKLMFKTVKVLLFKKGAY